MKSLVTGGAGFIGSHLVDRLIRLRHRVVVIDNLSTGKRAYVNPRASFYRLDIQDKKVQLIFKKERLDYLFHFAAQKDVRVSVRDPLFDARVNIIGSLNLLENAKRYHLKKFVFASTGGCVYGNVKVIPTSETHPALPICPYGVAKLTVETYLDCYHRVFGLPYSVLRYGNVYGPRQDPDGEAGVVAVFTKLLLDHQTPTIYGTGRQTRDYLYIDDAVNAAVLSLKRRAAGIYNIGTARETSVNELYNKMIKIVGIKTRPRRGPARPGEQTRGGLGYQRAWRELRWKPQTKLEQGLHKTIDWFANNL